MKRSRCLVDYESGSDEEYERGSSIGPGSLTEPDKVDVLTNTIVERPVVRRRKLPTLSTDFTAPYTFDDPTRHQGRRRSTPHVEGQFAAYVYIPVLVEKGSQLHKLLCEVSEKAKVRVPKLQSEHFLWDSVDSGGCKKVVEEDGLVELHISLTRSVYLRHYQREELRRAVKAAAGSISKFPASFAAFATYENDERSRAFIGVEIGAGHADLSKLTAIMNNTLRLLHQKEFYAEPRYHASFAWALLDSVVPTASDDVSSVGSGRSAEAETTSLLKLSSLPDALAFELNRKYASKLVAHGVFDVERVKVKIGKDVSSWRLRD